MGSKGDFSSRTAWDGPGPVPLFDPKIDLTPVLFLGMHHPSVKVYSPKVDPWDGSFPQVFWVQRMWGMRWMFHAGAGEQQLSDPGPLGVQAALGGYQEAGSDSKATCKKDRCKGIPECGHDR